MNIGDILIGALVVFAIFAALLAMNKDKNAENSCGGDCASCGACDLHADFCVRKKEDCSGKSE